MQEMPWLESHIGSLEKGIERINRYYWSLEVVEGTSGQQWFVKGGEAEIFRTDSRQALEAFLYGMCLAYAVIPDPLFDRLVNDTNEWVE